MPFENNFWTYTKDYSDYENYGSTTPIEFDTFESGTDGWGTRGTSTWILTRDCTESIIGSCSANMTDTDGGVGSYNITLETYSSSDAYFDFWYKCEPDARWGIMINDGSWHCIQGSGTSGCGSSYDPIGSFTELYVCNNEWNHATFNMSAEYPGHTISNTIIGDWNTNTDNANKHIWIDHFQIINLSGTPVWNSTGGYDSWGAYEFTGGADERIVIPDSDEMDNFTEMTITAWIYPHSGMASWNGIVVKADNDTGVGNSWHLARSQTAGQIDKIRFSVQNSSGQGDNVLSSETISSGYVNKWTFIAATWRGSTKELRFYKNGALDNSTTGTNVDQVLAGTDDIWIGDAFTTPPSWDGLIDEVMIYNKTLSAEQVMALYQNRTDLIVSQETSKDEVWQACITPNDGNQDGTEKCSNNLTIVEAIFCPAGMSGLNTSASPCMITNCTELQAMNESLDSYYALANDVECSATSGWNSGAGFAPVGDNTNKFTGSLDGKNHTVSNLYVNKTGDYTGLFGYTNGAEIRNIGIEDASIYGSGNSIAGIAGYAEGATNLVSSSYVTGKVSGNFGSSNYIGCIVGRNYGKIADSYATCNVSGASSVGGLVGVMFSGYINRSYAAGNVSCNTAGYAGGLVGDNNGAIYDSFASSNVNTGTNIAGLVGYQYGSGSITNSYWNNHSLNPSSCVGPDSGSTDCTTIQDNGEYFFDVNNEPMVNWSYPPWDSFCNSSAYPSLEWQNITDETYCPGYTPNQAPVQAKPAVNSSLGANQTTEDIICWANATDADGDNLTYEGYWYRNGAQNTSFNTAPSNYTQGTLVNVSTLSSSMTSVGDNWSCYVRAYDGINYSQYNMSSNITIIDSIAPSVERVSQSPADIDTINIFDKSLNITYNITDSASALNESSITLHYKVNSTQSECWITVNGTATTCNFTTRAYTSNDSSEWLFRLYDNHIYPATYNFNERSMELTPHSEHLIDSDGKYVKVRLFNVSNSKNYSLFGA